MSIYSDPKINNPFRLSDELYVANNPEKGKAQQAIIPERKMPGIIHRRADSTSNTQNLNDSSADVSPNCSGIMILEQFEELKKLLKAQDQELLKHDEDLQFSDQMTKKMNEIIESENRDQGESLYESTFHQLNSFHYHEDSRPAISPVPNENEESIFASSLMSMSDYQIKFKENFYDYEPMLTFTRGFQRKLNFEQKTLIKSHIPGLRL